MQSVAPQIARRINDRVAMDLLLAHGQMTRSEMRTATGMSQPSTLELFERLLEGQLISRAGSVAGRRGPQAQTFRVNDRRALIAVARVDSVEAVAGVSDLAGKIIGPTTTVKWRQGLQPAEAVSQSIQAALASNNIAPTEVHSVSLATPGVIDPATGDVSYIADRPEWSTLRRDVEHYLSLSVFLENRVKLLGLAELRQGCQSSDFVVVSIGPAGIAAALVQDGKLMRGAHGAAGEIAYLPLGQPIQLESGNRASGGLLKVMADAQWSEHDTAPPQLVGAIAQAIGAICAVVDPGHVVTAGPWGVRGGQELASAVEAQLSVSWPMRVTVSPTTLSGDAILIGAAAAGAERAHDDLWGPRTALTRRSKE